MATKPSVRRAVVIRRVKAGYLLAAINKADNTFLSHEGKSLLQFATYAILAQAGVPRDTLATAEQGTVIEPVPDFLNWEPAQRTKCKIFRVGNPGDVGESVVIKNLDDPDQPVIGISSGHVIGSHNNSHELALSEWAFDPEEVTHILTTPYGLSRANKHLEDHTNKPK